MLNRLSLNKLSLNRIDLNRIGGRDVGGSARPYIDPELLSHVKMAISTWGKSNDDPDRTVLKDLSGNGNDMRLLNFGFAENSGYGLYSTDFTTWTKSSKVTSVDYKSFNFDTSANWVLLYHKSNLGKDTPSFKVYINADGALYYNYINQEGILKSIAIKSEDFETPVSYNTLYMGETPVIIGFTTFGACKGSITQLPDFEGWLCTDGVDDIIESVNPVSEMLEGSNEITVVSIIHQISQIPGGESNKGLNNQIVYYDSPITRGYLRNHVKDIGKTGIYGYTFSGTAHSVINNILGDKTDYIAIKYKEDVALNGLFSVCGYKDPNGVLRELSQIAYAGGFIANKVLTTDEINQIIAYFNLDRPGQIIKPQLYCNIKKQGITNDNHAEFNDQLIDFVGGHNIQLNNIGWEGESGINSYPVVFGNNKTWTTLRSNSNNANYEVTSNVIKIYKSDNAAAILYSYVYNNGISRSYNIPSFKLRITGLKEGQSMRYKYVSESDKTTVSVMTIVKDDTYDMPRSYPIEPNESTPNGSWIYY